MSKKFNFQLVLSRVTEYCDLLCYPATVEESFYHGVLCGFRVVVNGDVTVTKTFIDGVSRVSHCKFNSLYLSDGKFNFSYVL